MTQPSTSTGRLVEEFHIAPTRLLMLDYDGVLSPLKNDTSPEASRPDDLLKQQLANLATQDETHIYIVSGRKKDDLDSWFNDTPSIGLSAEHGAWRKENGNWSATTQPFDKLKEQVVAALLPFVERVPGSHIEAKEFAVVWHFRAAQQPAVAEAAIPDIQRVLGDIVKGTDLAIHTSASTGKIIEVKHTAANKGAVVRSLVAAHNTPHFIMAAGDDYTDEDAFAACPPQAWTVKVGEGETAAKLRLADTVAVRQLISDLLDKTY